MEIYIHMHGSVPDIPPKAGGSRPEPRAAGGPVTAGVPYLVGEKGPELCLSICPWCKCLHHAQWFSRGGGGYVEQNIFNITAIDPEEAASKVPVILARRSRLNAAAGWSGTREW